VAGKTSQGSRRGTEGRRAARVGSLIQAELSAMIQRGLKDPRLDMVSITGVEVTDDLQAAKIFFCVYDPASDGGRSRAAAAAEGFASAIGFIRRELLHRLDLKKLPDLTFHYDASFDYGDRIERLLKEARTHGIERQDSGEGTGGGDDGEDG
jgi:ribosome-binding factor A